MSNFEIIRGQQIQNQEKVLAKKPNWIVGNKFGNSRIKVPNTVTWACIFAYQSGMGILENNQETKYYIMFLESRDATKVLALPSIQHSIQWNKDASNYYFSSFAFARYIMTLNNFMERFTSSKTQTSPTVSELSCANLYHPFLSEYPTDVQIQSATQVLSANWIITRSLFFHISYASLKAFGTCCQENINNRSQLLAFSFYLWKHQI